MKDGKCTKDFPKSFRERKLPNLQPLDETIGGVVIVVPPEIHTTTTMLPVQILSISLYEVLTERKEVLIPTIIFQGPSTMETLIREL